MQSVSVSCNCFWSCDNQLYLCITCYLFFLFWFYDVVFLCHPWYVINMIIYRKAYVDCAGNVIINLVVENIVQGLTWLLPERFSESEIGPEAGFVKVW